MKMEKEIEKIAAEILGLETLEARNMDSLDFSDQSVWQLKEALEAAYVAGRVNRMNKNEYKAIRQSLGTQAEVAAMLGNTRETICRRESGKDKITQEAALAIEALINRKSPQDK